jgi:4-hydroxymandelate oxidase
MEVIRAAHEQARLTLPEPVYDYVAGGAGDERGLEAAEAAWREWSFLPRVMRGGPVDTTVELLGHRLSTPVLLAPIAAQRMLHPDGEVASARAAAAAGTVFCLSTRATTDLGDLAVANPDPEVAPWFQLYVPADRSIPERMLVRLADHGYGAVVLTVDLPVAARRERERRHGPITLPDGVTITDHLGTAVPAAGGLKPETGGWDAELRWEDVAWVARVSGLPVLVKGILHPEDARLAADHGAAGVIVSAHGGRQLDGALPTARALPGVVAALDGTGVPVLVDGGIRDGGDVVRALALGARAVLIGRPYAWGLAAGGEDGVRAILDALTADVAVTLALVGAQAATAVDPAVVVR